MVGFGNRYLNARYDAWRTMSDEDYYEQQERSFRHYEDEDAPDYENDDED